MTVAVIAALYGGYDLLRPQREQTVDVDWYCFTDTECGVPAPWQPVVIASRCADPRMAAKWAKMQPHLAVPGYDDVIWIDANTETISPRFVEEALTQRRDGLAAFRHPRRGCIYTEAQASLGAESQDGKYDGEPILDQIAHYRAAGHPSGWGLWACGTIAYDLRDRRARAFGDAWLAECLRWSVQDQLSFPVVARRLGMQPGVFGHPQLEARCPHFGNRWQIIHHHLR